MSTFRLDRLRAQLRQAGVEALGLVPGANLAYLLGLSLHSSERLAVAILTADGRAGMVLPELERPRAAAEATTDLEFFTWRDDEGYAPALRRAVTALDLSGRSLGVEYTAMRVLELRALEQAAEVSTSDATPLLATLRMVKDAGELAAMREAVRIVEAGLQAAIAAIRPGLSERQVADVWEQAMAAAGSAGPSFSTIVASGPNTANPHHTTGNRIIQLGDLVLLDGGARHDGYCSDITRTVAVGEPSAEVRGIYAAVLEANAAGRAAARPGASGADIDAAARAVIEAAGYGPQFVHRTGHGLGIEIHEPPYLHAASHQPLPSGATFTIEPGIYLPDVGGVRIEDDVVLTDAGGESLTSFPRELMVVAAL